MRRALLAAAVLASACACQKPEAPAAAPETSMAAPAAVPIAGGPSAAVFNGTGAEVRDVSVSCPDISFSSSTASLPAGAHVTVPLPTGCARVSVAFTREPDRKAEKTVDLRGDSATFTLAADGSIGAAMQP